MKKILVLFISLISLSFVFATDFQSFVNAGLDYGICDVESSKQIPGVRLDWDMTIVKNLETKILPYAGAGVIVKAEASKDDIVIRENGFTLRLGGGVKYRIKNNLYAFGGAEGQGLFVLEDNPSSKVNAKFLFRSVGTELGVELTDGSVGVKGGALLGYTLTENKSFMFRPYVSAMIGLPGNTIYKVDKETKQLCIGGEVAPNLKINFIGAKLSVLPASDDVDTGFIIGAHGGKEIYFRFDSADARVAPMIGYTAGLGYGTMALSVDTQCYGGIGVRIAKPFIFTVSGGAGLSLGFLKGVSDPTTSDVGKILAILGFAIPTGYELDFFVSPSFTFAKEDARLGIKLGCDVGYMMWANAFGFSSKANQNAGGATGVFFRPYLNVGLK